MAELGHPVIGPQSMWKLTKSELRIYAEGMHVQNERKRKAREDAQNDDLPSGHKDHLREREDDALASIDAQVENNPRVPSSS